jgi:hypothetical protein
VITKHGSTTQMSSLPASLLIDVNASERASSKRVRACKPTDR